MSIGRVGDRTLQRVRLTGRAKAVRAWCEGGERVVRLIGALLGHCERLQPVCVVIMRQRRILLLLMLMHADAC